MKKLLCRLITLSMFMYLVPSAEAQVSIGIGLPSVSIGINLPLYPHLVPVPGYPVYYAPQVNANYFFYDGMYWVYQNDGWYASSWYNGPWGFVDPEAVPLFVLRIPVRYYQQPPVYFRGWQSNAPPRWDQHWGRTWEQRRSGWNRWNRNSSPSRAPLPVYQRQYSGDRYPQQLEQQHNLHTRQYRYQPRDKTVQQHFRQQAERRPSAPAHRGRQEEPQMRNQRQQIPQPAGAQREHQERGTQGQEQKSHGRSEPQEPNRGHGQGQNKDDERGRGRNN